MRPLWFAKTVALFHMAARSCSTMSVLKWAAGVRDFLRVPFKSATGIRPTERLFTAHHISRYSTRDERETEMKSVLWLWSAFTAARSHWLRVQWAARGRGGQVDRDGPRSLSARCQTRWPAINSASAFSFFSFFSRVLLYGQTTASTGQSVLIPLALFNWLVCSNIRGFRVLLFFFIRFSSICQGDTVGNPCHTRRVGRETVRLGLRWVAEGIICAPESIFMGFSEGSLAYAANMAG